MRYSDTEFLLKSENIRADPLHYAAEGRKEKLFWHPIEHSI